MESIKIKLSTDEKLVKAILQGLENKNWHCPCRLKQDDSTLCMCDEFLSQIQDETFEGSCHCGLWVKTNT